MYQPSQSISNKHKAFIQHIFTKQSNTLYQIIPTFYDPEDEGFENIQGKEENAGTQHFLLFPQCFLFFNNKVHFLSHSNAFDVDKHV